MTIQNLINHSVDKLCKQYDEGLLRNGLEITKDDGAVELLPNYFGAEPIAVSDMLATTLAAAENLNARVCFAVNPVLTGECDALAILHVFYADEARIVIFVINGKAGKYQDDFFLVTRMDGDWTLPTPDNWKGKKCQLVLEVTEDE